MASNNPKDYRLQKNALIKNGSTRTKVSIECVPAAGGARTPFDFNWDEEAYPNVAIQRVDQRGMLKPSPESNPPVEGYGDIYLSLSLCNHNKLPVGKYPGELASAPVRTIRPRLVSLVAQGLNSSGKVSLPVELLSPTLADLSRGFSFDDESGRLTVSITQQGADLFGFGFPDEPDPGPVTSGTSTASGEGRSDAVIRRLALSGLEELARSGGSSSVATLLRTIIDLTSS